MWVEAARVPVETAPSPGAVQGSHILQGDIKPATAKRNGIEDFMRDKSKVTSDGE